MGCVSRSTALMHWSVRLTGSIVTLSEPQKAQRLADSVCFLYLFRFVFVCQHPHHQRIAEHPDYAGLIASGHVTRFDGVTVADRFAAEFVSHRREIDQPSVMLHGIAPAAGMQHTETGRFVFSQVAVF